MNSPPVDGRNSAASKYGSIGSPSSATPPDCSAPATVTTATGEADQAAGALVPPKPAVRKRIREPALGRNINSGEFQPDMAATDKATQSATMTGDEQYRKKEHTDCELTRFDRIAVGDSGRQVSDSGKYHAQLVRLDLSADEAKGAAGSLADEATCLQVREKGQPASRPYPKQVLLIVANEFCERFSYYGLRTVLVLYFRSVLGFSDSSSTIAFHMFVTLCYLMPVLGAILGDSVWGKFKTILYLSIVYFLGEFILVLASIFWDHESTSVWTTFLGLFFIGVGTGGIKPCVSALGGDQFAPDETKWRQTFFSLFYGAINSGALISTFLTPMLRSNFHCVNRSDCYPYAFGVPCALMLVSILVFLAAKNSYTLVPLPERNVIVAFCRCVWLALKRRITGAQAPSTQSEPPAQASPPQAPRGSGHRDDASSASLSTASTDAESCVSSCASSAGGGAHQPADRERQPPSVSLKPASEEQISVHGSRHALVGSKDARDTRSRPAMRGALATRTSPSTNERDHFLYLASDRFDAKSIEDFRQVLGLLLLFVPISVYWCLFDQQSSLWTLQATRMDGRIYKDLVLEPDQMSVANPLLLLAAIPVFEIAVYPGLGRFGLLTKPIQRITAGGFLAALTFVLSALIEFRIQQFQPPTELLAGQANLRIVNGLAGCSLADLVVLRVNEPDGSPGQGLSELYALNATTTEPLRTQSITVPPGDYQLKFRTVTSQLERSAGQDAPQALSLCPFDRRFVHQVLVGPVRDKSVNLVYLEQGNAKIRARLIDDSLELPPPSAARVRLIYESFGSSATAQRRKFALKRPASLKPHQPSSSGGANATLPPASEQLPSAASRSLGFQLTPMDGPLLVSKFVDVPVPFHGTHFVITTDDGLLNAVNAGNQSDLTRSSAHANSPILLKPGTRSLIVVYQKDSTQFLVQHELLQDNDYRISILYQLGPYLLISISEVMFSITGLEFSYSMAPESMKSLILGAWSLTTAFGNILTVAIESLHLFSNISYDFLFYAALMALDMILFAILGYYYKPYKANNPANSPALAQANKQTDCHKQ